MAEFAEALGDALCGRYKFRELRSTVDSRTGVKARMNRLLKVYGGNRRRAAAAAGIPYTSWGYMTSGKRKTSPKNLGKLEAAYGRIITSPYRSGIIAKRGYPVTWSIRAVVVADPDGSRYINGQNPGVDPDTAAGFTQEPEYRWFNATLSAADSRGVVDAWLGGGGPLDDDAAAGALVAAIEDDIGPFGFEGNTVEVELHGRQ